MEEKILTGYPSIDKPWLKHYTEKWSKDLIPQKTVYRNIYDNIINYKNSKEENKCNSIWKWL